MRCDVCGLPDPYRGQGDGIGSCDCPPCDGGEAAQWSVFCTCPPDDPWEDPEWESNPWLWVDPPRPVVTVELPGVSR